MATQERDELRELVEGLPEEQVSTAVAVMRQLADVGATARTSRRRPSWVGALHDEPTLSSRVKDIVADELGSGRGR